MAPPWNSRNTAHDKASELVKNAYREMLGCLLTPERKGRQDLVIEIYFPPDPCKHRNVDCDPILTRQPSEIFPLPMLSLADGVTGTVLNNRDIVDC